MRVVREPRIYSASSRNSWFKDMAGLAQGDNRAERNLAQHAKEVIYEIDHNTPEGRAYEKNLRELCREHDPISHERQYRQAKLEARSDAYGGTEQRSDSTGATSMGAFVTPLYVLQQWAPFRGTHRSFVDQTTILPLPDYGMAVNIPSFTTTASAGVQASGENTAIAETDPSGANLQSTLLPIAGQLTISQQLHDRAWDGGGSFDVIIGQQIKQQLDETVDKYVLSQAIAAGVAVTGSAQATSFMADFYGDIGDCRNQLTDTAGTKLRGTHVFTTSDLYSYATRQLDGQNRPVVIPMFTPGAPVFLDGQDKDRWWGFTGTIMPGTLFWFTDDNIPAQGNNTQIIVSAPEYIVTWEGAPALKVWPETLANQMSVVVQLYEYIACIPRYGASTAYTSSNVYPLTLK